jgi:hypothetical protein
MPTQYQKIYAAIQSGSRGQTIDDVIGAVVDGLCGALGDNSVLNNVPVLGGIGLGVNVIYGTYKLVKSKKDLADSPNPYFVLNGHADDTDPSSPVTLKYVRSRLGKSMAGGAIGFASAAVGSAFLADVDVVGGLQHINATGSTAVHLYKFKAIAKSYKQSETISKWLDLIITMKAMKATVRGSSIVGSLVPGAGLPIGIANAIAKIGIKLTMTKVCYWTAAELHWRAFVEKKINRNAVGPGGRILTELFTRRGATRIFGKYDLDAIITEPCGWMAVADKICLI